MTPPFSDSCPKADQSRWFAEEVYVHESSLRAYLRSRYPSAPDVDDIVQESLLRVWKARLVQPVQFAKSFLFCIARHLVIDGVRRKSITPINQVTDLAFLAVLEERQGPDQAACTSEEIALLASAIDSLPTRCREILILRKLRCASQKAIAAQLGISEQTVQVQVARGVRRCEEILRRRGVRARSLS